MNTDVRDGFLHGSGLDPATLKLVLVLLTLATCIGVGTWIVAQLINAYRNEDIKSSEVVWGAVKTVVLLGLVFVIVSVFK